MSGTIAVTGGQGVVGQITCKSLLEGRRVDRVIALDLHTTGRIKGIEEKVVDVHNKAELVKALKGVDVVVNLVAPYYLHGTVVADAAFEAGAHYTDISADVPITEKLLEEDKKWKDAGLTLITGMGAAPGTSNLMIAEFASNFDKIIEAHIAWVAGQDPQEIEESATLKDFIKMEFGKIVSFIDGKMVTVQGFVDGAEDLKFGDKTVTVYHSGHSEPITVPRYFPGIRTVTVKGNGAPFGICEIIGKAVEIGLDSEEEIEVKGNKIKPIDFLTSYFTSETAMSRCDLSSMGIGCFLQVRVVGLRAGKEETRSKTLKFPNAVSFPAVAVAISSEAIANGEIKLRGAFAPEALDAKLSGKLIRDTFSRHGNIKEV